MRRAGRLVGSRRGWLCPPGPLMTRAPVGYPCVGIRAVPIGEAIVACVIADHYLRRGGQIGDNPAWPFPPPAR